MNDIRTLLDDPMMLAATLAVVLIGKPLAALAIVVLFRYPLKVALAQPLTVAGDRTKIAPPLPWP